MQKHLKLISGSDLRGVAVDIGGGVTIDRNTARAAAYQFAAFLREKCGKEELKIAVGARSAPVGPGAVRRYL